MEVSGYICSYPKSGRTWLRFALANLLNDHYQLGEELNLENQFALLPNDDQSRSQPWKEVEHFAFQQQGVPLLAASHQPWDRRFIGRPTVFLLRNPSDVLPSRYRHLKFHQQRFSGTIAQFLDSQWGLDSLVQYLHSWAGHLDQVLLVRYERLRASPEKGLSRIAAHLNIAASAAEIDKALSSSTLERMRHLEQQFGVGEPNDYDRSDWRARRVGRAQIGAGSQQLGALAEERLRQALRADPDV